MRLEGKNLVGMSTGERLRVGDERVGRRKSGRLLPVGVRREPVGSKERLGTQASDALA
jgi:hypothetical protein